MCCAVQYTIVQSGFFFSLSLSLSLFPFFSLSFLPFLFLPFLFLNLSTNTRVDSRDKKNIWSELTLLKIFVAFSACTNKNLNAVPELR